MISIKSVVRKLRKNQTRAEEIFWDKVRNRKFNNLKIIRQYPIIFEIDNIKKFFVADFYCHKYKLIIEIDGEIHNKQKGQDRYRTYLLNTMGYKVIRFKNIDVFNNIDLVLKEVG